MDMANALEAFSEQARLAVKARDWTKACSTLESGIALSSTWLQGYIGLSRALGKAGREHEALKAIERGVRLCGASEALERRRGELLAILPCVQFSPPDVWDKAVAQLEIDLHSDATALDVAAVLNRARRTTGLEPMEACAALDSCLAKEVDGPLAMLQSLLGAARGLPRLFPEPLPLLVDGVADAATLSRWQVCSLLAAGVLGLIPRQRPDRALPVFDFDHILACQPAKVECLLLYFRRALSQESTWQNEFVSFQRSVLAQEAPERTSDFWSESQVVLRPVLIQTEGGIEDAHGLLQADFANEYLGGGVFFEGCVQEEIRFSVCPELLVSCLFCEAMLADEAVVLTGAQQFACYKGYGRRFEAAGPFTDPTPLDSRGRREVQIVAFDAMQCAGDDQYQVQGLMRELVKAAVAFEVRSDEASTGAAASSTAGAMPKARTLATGNWGAGAFGGDPQLKFLLQWMACSVCGRDMQYYPFGDVRMGELALAIKMWSGRTVGEVWHAVQRVHATQPRAREATKWKYRP